MTLIKPGAINLDTNRGCGFLCMLHLRGVTKVRRVAALAGKVFRGNTPTNDAEFTEAMTDAGLAPGTGVCIALDIAATQPYQSGHYQLALEKRALSVDQETCNPKPTPFVLTLEEIQANPNGIFHPETSMDHGKPRRFG